MGIKGLRTGERITRAIALQGYRGRPQMDVEIFQNGVDRLENFHQHLPGCSVAEESCF